MARTCVQCGASLAEMRSDAKHCGNPCRQAAYRERRRVTARNAAPARPSTAGAGEAGSPREPYAAVTEPLPGGLTEDELVARIKEMFDAEEFEEVEAGRRRRADGHRRTRPGPRRSPSEEQR